MAGLYQAFGTSQAQQMRLIKNEISMGLSPFGRVSGEEVREIKSVDGNSFLDDDESHFDDFQDEPLYEHSGIVLMGYGQKIMGGQHTHHENGKTASNWVNDTQTFDQQPNPSKDSLYFTEPSVEKVELVGNRYRKSVSPRASNFGSLKFNPSSNSPELMNEQNEGVDKVMLGISYGGSFDTCPIDSRESTAAPNTDSFVGSFGKEMLQSSNGDGCTKSSDEYLHSESNLDCKVRWEDHSDMLHKVHQPDIGMIMTGSLRSDEEVQQYGRNEENEPVRDFYKDNLQYSLPLYDASNSRAQNQRSEENIVREKGVSTTTTDATLPRPPFSSNMSYPSPNPTVQSCASLLTPLSSSKPHSNQPTSCSYFSFSIFSHMGKLNFGRAGKAVASEVGRRFVHDGSCGVAVDGDDAATSYGMRRLHDMLIILATRLYFSPLTTYLYSFVLVLNGWVLYRGLFLREVDILLVLAECFVTFMMVLEVAMRFVIQGKQLLSSFDGQFDLAITAICVFLLLLSGDLWRGSGQAMKPASEEVEDVLQQSLSAFRFSTQLLRMIPIALHHKRSQLPKEDVDFSLIHARARSDDL